MTSSTPRPYPTTSKPPAKPPKPPAKPPKTYAFEYWEDIPQTADVILIRQGNSLQLLFNPMDANTIELVQAVRYATPMKNIRVEQYQPDALYIDPKGLYAIDDVVNTLVNICKHLKLSVAETDQRLQVQQDFLTEGEIEGEVYDQDEDEVLATEEE